jgi:dTDP-D-glucose 4,6-dehydratase
MTYASLGMDRLKDINVFDSKRVTNYVYDLTQPLSLGLKKEIGKVDYIINLASESHVDNSITNPREFVDNNVQLALTMLEYAREIKPEKFIQFSTDEVYGTAPDGINYKEGDRYNSGNPYSASKAMQECLCYAYSNTYKLNIQITNTMNVLGERQHPEKYLPLCINKILSGDVLSIHSNEERTKAGTRFYIHARNVADALLYILMNSDEYLDNIDSSKGKFHIVGEKELDNLELAQLIEGAILKVDGYGSKKLNYKMVDFHSSRPGHDLRYAMSGEKMKKIGWSLPTSVEQSINNIIKWSLNKENLH